MIAIRLPPALLRVLSFGRGGEMQITIVTAKGTTMIYHVKIDTHQYNWVDLYFDVLPPKETILETIDSVIKQYDNGKPQQQNNKPDYWGKHWTWYRNIKRWKRAWKIVNYPADTEFDTAYSTLLKNVSLSDDLYHSVCVHSRFSNGYNIHFTAVKPLVTRDQRLDITLSRF